MAAAETISHASRRAAGGGLPGRDLAGLLLAGLVVLLPGVFGVSLFDRDEGWYAQVAREMLARGDWIVPTYLGEPWIAKPPLLYWCVASAYALFGVEAWAARLVSVLATALGVLILGDLTARVLNRRAAWFAAITFVTAALPTVVGRMVLTDPLLLLCVCAACWLLWRRVAEAGGFGCVLAFWFVVGLGVLAKGPAVVVFVGPFGLGLLLAGPWRAQVLDWRLWAGVPLAVAVAGPWYLLVAQRAGDALATQLLGFEILRRFSDPPHGHAGPPGYYLLFSLAGLLPWTALAPGAVFEAFGRWRCAPAMRLLLVWLAAPWLFLELVPSKLPHYVVPCYVPLAMLMGSMWDRGLDAAPTPLQRRVLGLWAGVPVVLGGLGVAAGIAAAARVGRLDAPALALGATGLTLAGGALLVARTVARGRLRRAFAGMSLAWAAAVGLAGGWLLRTLEPMRLSRTAAEAANALNPDGATVRVSGHDEPTLFFYLDAPGRVAPLAALAEPPTDAGGRVHIVAAPLLRAGGIEPAPFDACRTVAGFNYVNGASLELHVYRLVPRAGAVGD